LLRLGVGLRKAGVPLTDDELAAFVNGCDQVSHPSPKSAQRGPNVDSDRPRLH
jgi:hypothetical protein